MVSAGLTAAEVTAGSRGVDDEQVGVVEGAAERIERRRRGIVADPDRAALVRRRAAVERLRQDDRESPPRLRHARILALQPAMRRHVGAPPVEDDAARRRRARGFRGRAGPRS